MSQPWFRFYSEALNDRKIEHITRASGYPKVIIVGAWATLLALANDSPVRGVVLITEDIPLTDEDLALEMGLETEEVESLLALFIRFDMLSRENGAYHIVNWGKRQFSSDSSTERVRRWRERKQDDDPDDENASDEPPDGDGDGPGRNGDETLQKRFCNGPDTDTETDTKTETEGGADANAPPAPPGPVPDPENLTVAEIRALSLSDDGWRDLLQQEEQGKNRVTVHRHVRRVLDGPPPAVQVYQRVTEKFPKKALWDGIDRAVGRDDDDLEFWERVVLNYIACGWYEGSISTMLGYFGRREIPRKDGKRNGRNQQGARGAGTPARTTAQGKRAPGVRLYDPDGLFGGAVPGDDAAGNAGAAPGEI